MLITVKLPWWQSARLGKETVVFYVDTVPSELDGEVVMGGEAIALTSEGGRVKMPPYIPVCNVAKHIQNVLGAAEFGTKENARLD